VPRFVHAAPGVTLWAQTVAGPQADPVVLVADAGASLALWPEPLLAALAVHHPLICYDHRDTGRSRTSANADDGDAGAYDVATLAADAVAVLNAYDIARAHVLGWGVGGLIAQLLLLDHADRLASATLVATRPLPAPGAPALPGPPIALRRLWAELDDPRDHEGELAWRVAHDRLLHGTEMPFDAAVFRARHERAMKHAGTDEPVTAHLHLSVPWRGAELASIAVPTLVVEAPADPVHPPPAAATLAAALARARLVGIPGLGHVAGDTTAARLAGVVTEHLMSIPTSA
jgi:pimeloyl-ACP methyl ester carboxylesterase